MKTKSESELSVRVSSRENFAVKSRCEYEDFGEPRVSCSCEYEDFEELAPGVQVDERARSVPRLDRQPSVLAVARWQGAPLSLIISATVAALPARLAARACFCVLCLCSFVSTVLVSVCPGVGVNIFEELGVSRRFPHGRTQGPRIPTHKQHTALWTRRACKTIASAPLSCPMAGTSRTHLQ